MQHRMPYSTGMASRGPNWEAYIIGFYNPIGSFKKTNILLTSSIRRISVSIKGEWGGGGARMEYLAKIEIRYNLELECYIYFV